MIKKIAAYALAATLFCCALTSCKPKNPQNASSENVSSLAVSSQVTSSDEQGEQEEMNFTTIKNSFMAADQNGDFFYCGSQGGIYKQLADNKGISRIYSSAGYTFFSVSVIDEQRICVGYKGNKFDSAYIIFNLKDKTVVNAVSGDEFKNSNIYSLIYKNDAVYFMSNPDRYGRYTLYKQSSGITEIITTGVNEFFFVGDSIVYNVGNIIYWQNTAEADSVPEPLWIYNGSYLTGFSTAGQLLLCSTDSNSVFVRYLTGGYSHLETKLNAWSSTASDTHAFVCGSEGGIYAISFESGLIKKVSDYTAAQLFYHNGYLYLSPANAQDYPELDKSLIISGGIYRFEVASLLSGAQSDEDLTSSSIAQEETASSSLALPEIESTPAVPEKFGR